MFPENNQPFSTPAPQQPQQVPQQPQQYQQPTELQQPQYAPQQQPVQQPQMPTAQQPIQSDFDASQGQPVQMGDEQFGQFPQQQPNPQWQPSPLENQSIEQYQQQSQGQPQQPVQQPQQFQQPQQDYVTDVRGLEQNFEAWLDKEYPLPEIPKISDIPADDPEALEKYMTDLVEVSAKRNQVEYDRREVRAAKDDFLWSEVTSKYPNLNRAPKVMQTLKQMYAGSRAMGQHFTPLQITDAYVDTLNGVQQRGYQTANQQVQIRQSQPAPNAGGGTAPAQAITQQDMAGLNQNSNDVIENAADLVAKMRQQGVGGF